MNRQNIIRSIGSGFPTEWHNATKFGVNQVLMAITMASISGIGRICRISDFSSDGLVKALLRLRKGYAIEPRFGLKWEFLPGHSLNMGAGLHSQTQMRALYFGQRLVDSLEMQYEKTNQNLDFSRSLHLVTGYDRILGEGHRLKLEVYYQKLYNIPVSWRRPEFSLISQGGGFSFMAPDNMENTGTGENKGLELTLEKFLHRGFYYLVTASVFDAGYRGYDGKWRNSAFNKVTNCGRKIH